MVSTLRDFDSIAFHVKTWRVWQSEHGSFGPLLQSGILEVKARIPASLHLKDIRTKKDIEPGKPFIGYPFYIFISDGMDQYELAPESMCYVKQKAATDLADIQSAYGITEYVALDILFSRMPWKNFDFVGEEYRNDGSVIIYRCFRQLLRYRGMLEQKLYISDKTGLPVSISLFQKDIEVERGEYYDWEMNPTFANETFDTIPPPGTRPESELA